MDFRKTWQGKTRPVRVAAAVYVASVGYAQIPGPQAGALPVQSEVEMRLPSVLAWDSQHKTCTVGPNEENAVFDFNVSNVSSHDVIITSIAASCGCTVVDAPPLPWTLTPDQKGQLRATVSLGGKSGVLTKTITVESSHGRNELTVEVSISDSPSIQLLAAPTGANGMLVPGLHPDPDAEITGGRLRNVALAKADPQAVFKNDCAACHALPAAGKRGRELYIAACSNCHDSPHRATMVPQLTILPHPSDLEFWKKNIRDGIPGTLMPAFATARGGPLTDDQIASLAEYMDKKVSLQSLSPATLIAWKLSQPAEPKTVQFIAAPGKPVAIKSVTSSNAHFSAKIETVTPGEHYIVTVEPIDTTQKETAELIVQTASSDEPSRSYTIFARIK